MRKLVFISLSMIILFTAQAQKVAYKVSFPNAVHHEAHIELTVTGIPLQPAIFKMSRSSPGRYATHEFGKNVYDVAATDQSGKKITVNRIDGDVYEVPKHNGTVTISYTLFGNHSDGTYAGIDPESIHMNMPACFMWMKGLDKAPINIHFDIPKENKGVVATQLYQASVDDKYTFTAPNLQYFMDSPTKIGDQIIKQWFIENPDKTSFTMRIALESSATDAQAEELAGKVKKLVEEARSVFGEFPKYDYGTYTFIAGANPYVNGDGMEHRNSTMITTPMNGFSADRLLGVFSHEYFHNWNVERIRPKTLEPFNFEKSNMSNELWCAEGFTQYYGVLILSRAGLVGKDNFINTASGLVNTKMNTPGARDYSPVQASNHAVFVDAAVSIDKNNYGNMFTSYYTYGALIALALDLELQTKYNKTIDAFMQAMWKRFGKTEIPYTVATMQETLGTITDAKFAADFFGKYVNGHEAIDYASLFAKAGYDIKNPNAGKPTMGIFTGGGFGGRGGGGAVATPAKLVIDRNTTKGTSAYEAGLDINDEVLKLDDSEVKTQDDVTNFLKNKKVGDAVSITYKHRNIEKKTTLILKEQTGVSLVPFETSGKTVTDEMKKIRDSWTTSRV
ncbi:MAG: PDZ domain-containing protein, partial [Sediminibacterium sp.]